MKKVNWLSIPGSLLESNETLEVGYILKRGRFYITVNDVEICNFKDEDYKEYILKKVLETYKFKTTDELLEEMQHNYYNYDLNFSSHNSFAISFDALENSYMFCLIKVHSTYDSTIEEDIICKSKTFRDALIRGLVIIINKLNKE